MPLTLNSFEERLIESMAAVEASFVIFGGAAVEYYCPDRTHRDLDILIEQTPENLERLIDGGVFGFRDKTIDDWMVVGARSATGSDVPYDIVTSIEGVNSQSVFDTAVEVDLNGVAVKLISKALLIQSKEAVGEAKDLADIELLQRN